MAKTDEEKQLRYDAINNLSNILWAKYQKPVGKFKKLEVSQMEYMYEQILNTDREVKEIYEDALKLG